MSGLRALFSGHRDRIWRDVAMELGGTYREGSLLKGAAVQVTSGDWIVTLDTYTDPNSKMTFTRMRAPFVNSGKLRLKIYRGGMFSELGKMFGMQDIEIGDRFFDGRFVIQGNPPGLVHRFLDNQRLRTLMRKQPRFNLKVDDDEGFFGPSYPDGVDQLLFAVPGVIKDPGYLHGLFELFAEALNQLCHDGNAYEDDVRVHIARLRSPAEEIWSDSMLTYDGHRVRLEAVVALGKLGHRDAVVPLIRVLSSGRPAIRARAAEALGRLGSDLAVRPLIFALSYEDWVDNRPVSSWAAAALDELGAGAIARAVEAALARGEYAQLLQQIEADRETITNTLIAALEGPFAANAAWALVELKALEALPPMRNLFRRLGTAGRGGAAIESAIKALEGRASLPRPVAAPPGQPETLPRPAQGESTPDGDLPRSVDAPGDG